MHDSNTNAFEYEPVMCATHNYVSVWFCSECLRFCATQVLQIEMDRVESA